MNRLLFFTSLLIVLSTLAWGAEKALLRPTSTEDYRAQFTLSADGWQTENKGLVGTSPQYYSLPETALDGFPDDPWTYFVVHPVNLWRYAIAGQPEWTDYTLTTTITVEQPAPLKGHRPGDYFYNYQWGREAIGSDAGLIVRYQDQDNYYMVRLSSGYDHVELWKTHGGVVRVKSYHFEPNRAYQVSVTASGRWLIIAIDGKELMRYADPLLPLRNGQVGVGVRESRVRFSDIKVTPAAHLDTPSPAHKPSFHLRKWVGRDYIFDGDEPIGYFNANGMGGMSLCEVKLTPGLMPLLLPCVSMVSYTIPSTGTYTVKKEGKAFAFSAKLQAKDDAFTHNADWELTYDPASGYVWDKRATITMLKDKVLTRWPELDDPCFYQLVAPVTNKLPKCRTELKYVIKQIPDGSMVVFPNAQHEWVDALGGVDNAKLTIRSGGVNVTTVDGWGVVTELPKDNEYTYHTEYCHWGLDQHISASVRHVPVKGDSYTGHLRYYLWDPARTRTEIARGVFPPLRTDRSPWHTATQLIAHVEPVNHCDYLFPGLTGESVRQWTGNYTLDHIVGHGDTTSMRIDAAAIAKRSNGAYGDERPNIWLGPSYWTGPYLAPRYRFGIWVKADQFTGKVAFIANGFNPSPGTKKPDDIRVELPIQGKCDWTYLTFDASFPRQMFNWVLRIDPIGTGVIWVDDMEVTPLVK
ncbi:MAG: LamG domain-containing protein [Armatimonadota bacterium]